MVRYELQKVYSKTSNKVAVFLLLVVLVVTCFMAMDVSYVNESGNTEKGIRAARQLREAQKKWAGVLDEEKLRQVIAENRRIEATLEARSRDDRDNNIAYGWKQGFSEIRDLLNDSYAEDFRSFDYYRADRLNVVDASNFYANRIALLKEWLADEAKDVFSDEEKAYLVRKYEALDTPFYYDYMKGWIQVFEYSPTIIMITMLILGYLVAGIFSDEFQWKSDAIFFTAAYGRNRAVSAKAKAGFCIVTVAYWAAILLFTGAVLLYYGADGAGCAVQVSKSGWKCFYNIQIWQEYLGIIIGGYLGCLFISFLTMLVSAKTKSAVLAVMLPFVLIFIPSFLVNINSLAVSKVLGLLPDRLLQIHSVLRYFELYRIGGRVVGAVPILFGTYSVLTILILPVLYQTYRRQQIG